MPFQSSVNTYQAPGVAGEFASANPRASVVAGEGELVAGSGGCVVGNFAWADSNGKVTNAGSNAPTGFVHRNMNALIVGWLNEAGNTVQEGYGVTLMSAGDFWAKSATAATVGQKVFASNTDGSVKTGAAGATVTGFTETKWSVGSACSADELCKITTWS